jgi:hypothetical protein
MDELAHHAEPRLCQVPPTSHLRRYPDRDPWVLVVIATLLLS